MIRRRVFAKFFFVRVNFLSVNFRSLLIQRINAGVRENGMSYSQFIKFIKKAGIDIDRKILADIAKNNPTTFKFIVDKVRQTK